MKERGIKRMIKERITQRERGYGRGTRGGRKQRGSSKKKTNRSRRGNKKAQQKEEKREEKEGVVETRSRIAVGMEEERKMRKREETRADMCGKDEKRKDTEPVEGSRINRKIKAKGERKNIINTIRQGERKGGEKTEERERKRKGRKSAE